MRPLLPPLDGIEIILFDLGGVLFPDPWETVVLTPGRGLADRLGLPRQRCAEAGPALWPAYSRAVRREAEWWADFADFVGQPIPADLVAEASRELLVPFDAGLAILAEARASGRRLGVITDNTAFWFPVQAAALELASWAEPVLRYASHERGVGKKGGLFELAAAEHAAAATLVVDDRDHNLERAATCGFRVFGFRGADLAEAA